MNPSLRFASCLRAVVLLAVVGASACLSGCIGFGCGAGPVPTQKHAGDTATVDRDGVVVYDPTDVGDAKRFAIPVKDTADVDEVLVGATVAGEDADAFEVRATFPIDMPAGATVHVEVEFHPKRAGTASAELLIQTQDMGVSPAIDLTGDATVPN
ncbi:MAG TPA: hypothetical protein VHB21_06345 [Minicystis sp.]|nr:hypothetical protein [Minicystis sp.]